MQRVGDDEAGFSVLSNAWMHTVRVEAWGFWSQEVASAFGKTVIEVCLNTSGVNDLIMDMMRLKPMRSEGQEGFAMLLRELPELGITRTRVATASQLIKLQLLCIARDNAAKDSIQFVSAATDLASDSRVGGN